MICRTQRTWKVLLAMIDFRSSEQDSRIYDKTLGEVGKADENTKNLCILFGDDDYKRVGQMLTQGILANKEE